MLDVLIAVSEDTPAEWVAQSRASAQRAAACAGYPVNVIETPGVPGHIGKAMMHGFARTTAPYVAWVDDDDYVLPNAFACLAPHFEGRPQAICTREIAQGARGQQVPCAPQRRHHLTAWRRDVICVSGLADIEAPPIPYLLEHITNVADVLEWVYVYRHRRSAGMALRAAYKTQLAATA